MTTFGYEAEFHANVDGVMAHLHAEGLTGTDELHPYHCRCEWCSFESEWVYRGQHDSSCGGEIISYVFDTGDMDSAIEAMTYLQTAAVEADAEPNLSSGFHVHVGNRGIGPDLPRHLWAYLRWERWLGDVIANARFPCTRAFNYRLESLHYVNLGDVFASQEQDLPDCFGVDEWAYIHPALEDDLAEDDLALVQDTLLVCSYDFDDRHTWLNVNTRGRNTWEFRLWNSTRVAWRMEMFARLSVLFLQPDALDELLSATVSTAAMLDIARGHDDALGVLIERQVNTPHTNAPFTVMAA